MNRVYCFALSMSLWTHGALSMTLSPNTWTTVEMADLDAEKVPLAPKSSCGVDGRYAFGARRGSENKLVIQLQGGGLCYDKKTCIEEIGIPCVANQLASDWATPERGMLDHDNEENPVRNWNHVYIPYCTCDFHIGTKTTDLNFGVESETSGEFHFKGYNNVQAVWQWVKEYYKESFGQDTEFPEQLLWTGCSAGGYGASGHFSLIASDLKEAKADTNLFFLPDSSFGSIDYLFETREFTNEVSGNFFDILAGTTLLDTTAVKNSWLTKTENRTMADLHLENAKTFPDARMTTFGFEYDVIIRQADLQKQMSIDFVNKGGCNINSWISESVLAHCVISSSTMYISTSTLASGETFPAALDAWLTTGCTTTIVPKSYGDLSFTKKQCSKEDCSLDEGETGGSSSQAFSSGLVISLMYVLLSAMYLG